MKIKLFLVMFAILVATITVSELTSFKRPIELNTLALDNIEALSQDKEITKCPDYHYVPDHYLEAVEKEHRVTCTRKGEIQFGSHIIHGSFDKGQEYVIITETKNCDGEQEGACCDQREVGTKIIS